MIRHRPRTRGVAAQHASLSRWRSPVRIRSGPPSLFDSSHAPSARPDGAFLCPPTAVTSPVRYPAARDRPRSRLQPRGRRSPPRDARRGSSPRSSSRSSSAWASASAASCSAASAARLSRRRRPPGRRGSTATPDAPTASPDPEAPASEAPASEAPSASAEPAALVESDVAIVPVTNFRSGRTAARTADVRAIPGGDGTVPGLALVEADADAILATLGVTRDDLGDALTTVDTADDLARLAAQAPQGARVPARGRRRPVGPGAGLGRRRAVRRGPGGDAGRLAADRPAARAGGRRRRATTRPRPGRSSPAATSCSTGASSSRSRPRTSTSRSTAARSRSPASARTARRSAGTCRTPTGRATRRRARPRQGRRPRDRELREPGPQRVPVPRQRHELLRQPRLHRGARERRHRLGLAGQQPHRRRGPGRDAPDDPQRPGARDRVRRPGQERQGGAQGGDPRRARA